MEFNLELGRDIVRYESVNAFSPYKHFLFSFLHSIFHKSSTDNLMKIKKKKRQGHLSFKLWKMCSNKITYQKQVVFVVIYLNLLEVRHFRFKKKKEGPDLARLWALQSTALMLIFFRVIFVDALFILPRPSCEMQHVKRVEEKECKILMSCISWQFWPAVSFSSDVWCLRMPALYGTNI